MYRPAAFDVADRDEVVVHDDVAGVIAGLDAGTDREHEVAAAMRAASTRMA